MYYYGNFPSLFTSPVGSGLRKIIRYSTVKSNEEEMFYLNDSDGPIDRRSAPTSHPTHSDDRLVGGGVRRSSMGQFVFQKDRHASPVALEAWHAVSTVAVAGRTLFVAARGILKPAALRARGQIWVPGLAKATKAHGRGAYGISRVGLDGLRRLLDGMHF